MSLSLEQISSKLTVDILQDSINQIYLKKHVDENPRITNYDVNYASSKGDSYIGVIYRIKITLSNGEHVNIIAKGMPTNVARRQLFRCTDFFATEHLFYSKVVPAFRAFQLKQSKNDILSVIPECYCTYSDGCNDFLLLEDLCADGYEMADRNSAGLNVTQITSMIKMFAKFHAISLAMKMLYPQKFIEITKDINEPLYSKELENWYANNAIKVANIFYNSIKNESNLNSKYLDKLLDFIDPNKLYDTLIKNVQLKQETRGVICHGDIWITNFMFNNENRCKAIDFQLLRHASPMTDISTFIFTCITEEQRSQLGGVKSILNLYQQELNSTVTSLGAPESAGLTKDEVHQLWYQIGAHGFGVALTLVTISVMDSEDVGDLDKIDKMCELGLPLEDVITQFDAITSDFGKKRLIETVKLAVDEGLI